MMMIKHFTTGIALLALMTATATAEPILRASVSVTGDIVTVGDLFQDAGPFAQEAIFRAPGPGTSGIVSLEELEAAARRIGFAGYTTGTLPGVRVSRDAVSVTETDLVALIDADLRARGIVTGAVRANTAFNTAFSRVDASPIEAPATLSNLRYMPGSGQFTASFSIAGQPNPVEVSGRIDLVIEVPHLARALPAGTILAEADIVMRAVPLQSAESGGYTSLDSLVGKALQRQSREGLMLKATDVDDPLVVSRNDMVTIYYRAGPMTLTVKGQALNNAADGDTVQVLNLMSNRVIATTAIAAGAVEVSSAPLSVAGL
jgi:flagella basal body P-ring formation protein FlgA